MDDLYQACQTQTTSRAANAPKTDKRATKLLKKSQVSQILQNIMIENAFTYVLFGSYHVLVLKIVHIGKESKIMGKKNHFQYNEKGTYYLCS